MPQISLVAFADRKQRFIFVRVPDEFGRYVRTDKCVAQVACSQCNSTIGEPCRGGSGKYHGSTHWVRRRAADARRLAKFQEADDVIAANDGATVTIKDGLL